MFYVKTNSEGQLERYPYTLTDLRRDQSNVSLPRDISDETAAEYGVYPVTPADQPADDYTKNLERTAVQSGNGWTEQWTQVDASAEEITARTEAKAQDVRAERNKKLTDSDWTQLADSPADATAWATYRAALRDLPSTDGFPHNVTWPTEPS
jgi:hypothetical protein